MRYEEWRTGGARVRLLGRDAFVRVSGAGPALLFLHGFPTSSYDYSEIIAVLEGQFRCVTFDFWGNGDSDSLDRYDFDQQTDLTLAVAAYAGVTRAVVVAHDYGVTVAQELLARKPPGFAVDGVVFLNGALEPYVNRSAAIQRLLASPLGAVLAPLLINRRVAARECRNPPLAAMPACPGQSLSGRHDERPDAVWPAFGVRSLQVPSSFGSSAPPLRRFSRCGSLEATRTPRPCLRPGRMGCVAAACISIV